MSLGELLTNVLFMATTIGANSVFVAAEFSLARCRPTRIHQLAEDGNFIFRRIAHALDNLNDYISAAQVGITIASLILGAIAEPFFSEVLRPMLQMFTLPEQIVQPLAFALAITFATCIHAILGEFVPKTLALQDPEQVALLTILPLFVVYRLTSPLVWVLSGISMGILRLFGVKVAVRQMFPYTEDEIKSLLKYSEQEGIIEKKEREMVQKVFEFGDTVVREVMTPRTDIIGLKTEHTVTEAAKLASQHRISKLPIYRESFDDIFGIVNTADLLRALQEGHAQDSVERVARPILRVPENKLIADLLTDFKRNTSHMAIVLDEFGGTSGLVTLEDIIEEIVGDIKDEDEHGGEDIQLVAPGEYLVQASLSIDEVNESLNTSFSKEHFDTIGGFVFGLLGREAVVGDTVSFERWSFCVEKSSRRIERIRIKQLAPEPSLNSDSLAAIPQDSVEFEH